MKLKSNLNELEFDNNGQTKVENKGVVAGGEGNYGPKEPVKLDKGFIPKVEPRTS